MQINIFYNLPLSNYYKKTTKYKQVVLSALGNASRKNGEVNVVIVDKKEILKINTQFLNHNYVTDVISFNYPFDNKSGQPFGDVFVCFDVAKQQAKQEGHGILKELLILVAHGSLHLVGHEDDTIEKRNKMNAKAEKIAAAVLK